MTPGKGAAPAGGAAEPHSLAAAEAGAELPLRRHPTSAGEQASDTVSVAAVLLQPPKGVRADGEVSRSGEV